MGLSENVGYIPNEIAIFHRDNDQQNQWVFRGLANIFRHTHMKTNSSVLRPQQRRQQQLLLRGACRQAEPRSHAAMKKEDAAIGGCDDRVTLPQLK